MNIISKLKYLALLDWKKFKSNTTVLVLLVIYCLLAPILLLISKEKLKKLPSFFPVADSYYEFPTVWEYQGYIGGNWLVFYLLGFIIIYIITSEESNRTMRQNIITGLTKRDFFISKLITIIIIAFCASILYAFSTVIIGIMHTDGYDLELILDNNFAILKYFLITVGYLSFAMLLSIFIRRSMLTLVVYFFYPVLEMILMLIHVYYIPNESRNYWPLNSIEDLHPLPWFKLPNFFANNDWKFSILHSNSTAIGMTLVYTSIFLGLSYWVFMKRDV